MIYLRSTRIKFIFLTLFFLVVYNEWISFYLRTRSWPLYWTQRQEDSLRILIVADPQILSVQTEPYFPFSYVAVWDANRFVSRSFQVTLSLTQPDVIVFLGDLINDGSVSDHSQFTELAVQFKNLFSTPNVKEVLYLPGDNDIGGEGFDFTSVKKIQRFYSSFNNSIPVKLSFVHLYHINAIPGAKESLPILKTDSEIFNNDTFRMVFSHYPLTAGASKSNLAEINKIKPSIIFSAHDHVSYQLISKKDNPKASLFKPFQSEEILEINLKNEDLHEINVPTCSYRMGQANYGYGLAQVNKAGFLRYSVLWLPSRFTHVWLYFWGLVISIALLISPIVLHLTMKFKNQNSPLIALTTATKHHRI